MVHLKANNPNASQNQRQPCDHYMHHRIQASIYERREAASVKKLTSLGVCTIALWAGASQRVTVSFLKIPASSKKGDEKDEMIVPRRVRVQDRCDRAAELRTPTSRGMSGCRGCNAVKIQK